MHASELLDVIKTLKECGVTHFKQGDLEIDFKDPVPAVQAQVARNFQPVSLEIPPATPETEAPHIVQEMKSLLKLSDEELLDRVFPLPQEDEAS